MTVSLPGHLLTFHIYLMWNKLTTYEYILQQHAHEEAKEADKQLDPCLSQVRKRTYFQLTLAIHTLVFR